MEKLVNFRDLGGIKTADGRSIKKKRILRAGEVFQIGKADTKELIDDYQLKTIMDFRDEGECMRSPDDQIDGVIYHHIDIMKDIKETVTNPYNISGELDAAIADRGMQDVYRQITLDQTARTGYHKFLKTLLNQTDGAALFHCYAGKDRTGIGAAIILTILGASEEDIYEDYLKTNKQREAANQVILEKGRQKGMNEQQLDGLLQLMTVKAIYLHEMYQAIADHYGTFEHYITKGLLITDIEIRQLKDNYLE